VLSCSFVLCAFLCYFNFLVSFSTGGHTPPTSAPRSSLGTSSPQTKCLDPPLYAVISTAGDYGCADLKIQQTYAVIRHLEFSALITNKQCAAINFSYGVLQFPRAPWKALVFSQVLGIHSLFAPGPIRSRSESANRTLGNSLPGTFAPWNFRSPERIGPGTFAPWNFRCLELRTREYSLPGTFALWNFRSMLVRDIIWDVSLYI